ncbi:hypothetical protein [Undibacterium sp. Ren11W]|uniref:hypothetical protein n=1 Tax=Undibacterium sp. Ren11W TaxID=3413045 RepID=UPI003BF37942
MRAQFNVAPTGAHARHCAPVPIRKLAAVQASQELQLPKPLSEFALAEVVEAMRLLGSAERRIDAAVGALQQCRLPVDYSVFKTLVEALDAAHAALEPLPLASAVAEARLRGITL